MGNTEKLFNFPDINLFRGFFRVSLLISLCVFLWITFIEAPKHTSLTFSISDQDARDLRKAAIIEIDGHEYCYREGHVYENGVKVENIYKIKELGDYISNEEKNEIIKKYKDYWEKYGNYNNYICSVSYSCDNVIDRALKRVVNENNYINYSNGYLVSNEKYGIAEANWMFAKDGEGYISAGYSPDGYSIIPGEFQKATHCSKIGVYAALISFFLISFILPIVFNVSFIIARIPLVLFKFIGLYFTWVKKGFSA